MIDVLTELTGILQGVDADPQRFEVQQYVSQPPTVTIRFGSRADLERFAKADKAKVEHTSRAHLGHHEFSALYDRPGRGMLIQALIFPHMPEWAEITGSAE